MYACMFVFMYVSMCVYVCMYVCVCMCVCMWGDSVSSPSQAWRSRRYFLHADSGRLHWRFATLGVVKAPATIGHPG